MFFNVFYVVGCSVWVNSLERCCYCFVVNFFCCCNRITITFIKGVYWVVQIF